MLYCVPAFIGEGKGGGVCDVEVAKEGWAVL